MAREQTASAGQSAAEVAHGGRLVARALRSRGVSHLFTLSGGHLFSIYDGCRAEGIEIVDVLHEQAAVAMEAVYGTDLEAHRAALAVHYRACERWDRAMLIRQKSRGAFLAFAVVPFGDTVEIAGRTVTLQLADLNVAILFFLAMGSTSLAAEVDFGDLAADLFGIDSGAVIGLEYRFGLVSSGEIGIRRTNNRTIELFSQYGLVRQGGGLPIDITALVSIEGTNNFRDSYSPAVGAIVSRRICSGIAVGSAPDGAYSTSANSSPP